MNKGQQLRAQTQGRDIIVGPGAYDGAMAMHIREAGFHAVYMIAASVPSTFELSDCGLLTMTEMVGRVGLISGSAEISWTRNPGEILPSGGLKSN